MPLRRKRNPENESDPRPDRTVDDVGTEWLDTEQRNEVAWRPDPGSRVVGEIIDIDVRPIAWRDQVRDVVVLILDQGDPDFVTTVWCMQTVLANEVKKLAPQIGDTVGIIRLDDSDQGYRRYRVASPSRKDRKFDWKEAAPKVRRRPQFTPEQMGYEAPDDDLPF